MKGVGQVLHIQPCVAAHTLTSIRGDHKGREVEEQENRIRTVVNGRVGVAEQDLVGKAPCALQCSTDLDGELWLWQKF